MSTTPGGGAMRLTVSAAQGSTLGSPRSGLKTEVSDWALYAV